MIHLIFLSLFITTLKISSSSFSDKEIYLNEKSSNNLKLTPNASPTENDPSPIFSDRTHKPDASQINSLENSPEQPLLSPLLKRHKKSLSYDYLSEESFSVKIPDENPKDQNLKNLLKDNDKNSINNNALTTLSSNCPKNIFICERNKIIIASISLTLFAGGMVCLFLIKD